MQLIGYLKPKIYGLFQHQRVAADKVCYALSEPPRKVVLHMPTGAGKTRTAMHIVAEHLRTMVGRATRGPKAAGNKKAKIVTVIDQHLPGFDSVATAFKNWEDVWHDPT